MLAACGLADECGVGAASGGGATRRGFAERTGMGRTCGGRSCGGATFGRDVGAAVNALLEAAIPEAARPADTSPGHGVTGSELPDPAAGSCPAPRVPGVETSRGGVSSAPDAFRIADELIPSGTWAELAVRVAARLPPAGARVMSDGEKSERPPARCLGGALCLAV